MLRGWGATPRIVLGAAVALHVVLLALSLGGSLAPLYNDATHRLGRGEDFFCFYQAGRNALAGESIYHDFKSTYVVPYWGASGFRYLPIFAYTYGILFNVLPPWSAYHAWVAILECLLLFDVFLTMRRFPGTRPLLLAIASAMWLLFFPMFLELHMGQMSFFAGSLLFFMAMALERGGLRGMDDAWVVSGLTKTSSAILLPVVLKLGRWRAIALLVLVGGLSSAVYFALRPDDLKVFLSFNLGSSFLSTLHAGHLGLRALLLDLDSGFGWFGAQLRPAIWIVCGSVVVVSSLATWLAPREKTIEVMALWMTTYFLVYKDVWEHHYTMLLPFLVLVFLRGPSSKVLVLFVLLAVPTPFRFFDVPGIADPQGFWNRWVSVAYHASKILPTILVYLLLCARILDRSPVRRAAGLASAALITCAVALPLLHLGEIRSLGLADSSALIREGTRLEREGKVASARQAYLEALKVSPGSPLLREKLGKLADR